MKWGPDGKKVICLMSHLKEILFLLVVVKDIESKERQALDAPPFYDVCHHGNYICGIQKSS